MHIIECNVRELLPSNWTDTIWTSHLTIGITRDIENGIGIKRPLTVAELDPTNGKKFLDSCARLGFNIKHAKYLIDLGHHRFAAALNTRTETIKIEVVPFDDTFKVKHFDLQQNLAIWLGGGGVGKPLSKEIMDFLHQDLPAPEGK